MRSSWIRVDSKSNDKCFYKRPKKKENAKKRDYGSAKRKFVKMETETGAMLSQPNNLWRHQKLEEAGKILL